MPPPPGWSGTAPDGQQGRWPGRRGQGVLLLVAALFLLRLLLLGAYPLMDTTEARYGEIGRRMAELGDWITPWHAPGVPFWGKPPLSFWCTALSFRSLGVSAFTARLPHWLLGVAGLGLVWDLGRRRSPRQAVLAVALLAGSLIYLVCSGVVMTDMALAVALLLALRGFWLTVAGDARERRREPWLFFAGLALGLLAKGPIALVLAAGALLPWLLWSRQPRRLLARIPWLGGVALLLLIAAPWYLLAEGRTPGFLEYFLVGEHWHRFVTPGWSGDLYGEAHAAPRGMVWLYLLVGLLPWSLLLPLGLALGWLRLRPGQGRDGGPEEGLWRRYLLCWGLAPMVFFSFSGNVIWPYPLPGCAALALLGAAWLADQADRRRVDQLLVAGLAAVLALLLLAALLFPASGIGQRNSARDALAVLQNDPAPPQLILFWRQLPFSASFYSRGRAELVTNAAQLTERLDAPSRAALVVHRRRLEAWRRSLPPQLHQRLQPAGSAGSYVLYREP